MLYGLWISDLPASAVHKSTWSVHTNETRDLWSTNNCNHNRGHKEKKKNKKMKFFHCNLLVFNFKLITAYCLRSVMISRFRFSNSFGLNVLPYLLWFSRFHHIQVVLLNEMKYFSKKFYFNSTASIFPSFKANANGSANQFDKIKGKMQSAVHGFAIFLSRR